MIEAVRPWLELLYFVTGGPVLAFVALIALRQINVTKQVAKTSSTREAYKIAAEQVKIFCDEVIPAINEITEIIKQKPISSLNSTNVVYENKSMRLNLGKISEADKKLLVENSLAISNVLNRIDNFSLFFTSGVASEAVAYTSVGKVYVDFVEDNLPIIAFLNDENHFKNLVDLYQIWHSRREGEGLESEKAKIQKRLSELGNKTIHPIGTNA